MNMISLCGNETPAWYMRIDNIVVNVPHMQRFQLPLARCGTENVIRAANI